MPSAYHRVNYVTPEQISEAAEMDLLTYLENYEPNELVKVSDGVYCTKEHDSLKISNGKWYWWSQRFGGSNALFYLRKVKGMRLPDAVAKILGYTSVNPPKVRHTYKPIEQRELLLPKPADDNKRLYAYLIKERCIDVKVLKYFIDNHYIYECITHPKDNKEITYHNAVFIGYDEDLKARNACWRGLSGKRLMGDCAGSNKEYSFRFIGNPDNPTIHIFESAIDLLSYATLLKDNGVNWTNFNLISLAGVYQPKKNKEDSKIPIAINKYLDTHPATSTIYLHLDNDEAGRGATSIFVSKLSEKYKVIDNPVPFGKDVNDFLLIQKGYIKPFKYQERTVVYVR